MLVYGPKVKPGSLGHRETFADISQTVANYFGLSPMDYEEHVLSPVFQAAALLASCVNPVAYSSKLLGFTR